MEIYNSIGKYVIIASEATDKKSGSIHFIDVDQIAKGVVMAEPDDIDSINVDDEVLFIKADGIPIGHGLPQNVVAVKIDSIIAVIGSDELVEENQGDQKE